MLKSMKFCFIEAGFFINDCCLKKDEFFNLLKNKISNLAPIDPVSFYSGVRWKRFRVERDCL